MAKAWSDFLPDIESDTWRLRQLTENFTWPELSKAAKAVSTVSLTAYDDLLSLDQPLRDLWDACHSFRDFGLRELNTKGHLREYQVEYLAEDVAICLERTVPKMQPICDELMTFVPGLMSNATMQSGA